MQKKEHFAAAEKRRRAMKKYLLLTGAALIGLSGSANASNSALTVEMDGGYTTGIDKTSSRYVRCIISY